MNSEIIKRIVIHIPAPSDQKPICGSSETWVYTGLTAYWFDRFKDNPRNTIDKETDEIMEISEMCSDCKDLVERDVFVLEDII